MTVMTKITCNDYGVMGLLHWKLVGHKKRWIGDTQLNVSASQLGFPSNVYIHAFDIFTTI